MCLAILEKEMKISMFKNCELLETVPRTFEVVSTIVGGPASCLHLFTFTIKTENFQSPIMGTAFRFIVKSTQFGYNVLTSTILKR